MTKDISLGISEREVEFGFAEWAITRNIFHRTMQWLNGRGGQSDTITKFDLVNEINNLTQTTAYTPFAGKREKWFGDGAHLGQDTVVLIHNRKLKMLATMTVRQAFEYKQEMNRTISRKNPYLAGRDAARNPTDDSSNGRLLEAPETPSSKLGREATAKDNAARKPKP